MYEGGLFLISSNQHENGEEALRKNQMESVGTWDYTSIGHCCKSGHRKRFLTTSILYVIVYATVEYETQLCEGVSWNQLVQHTD
jgi:hypothetical protein